MSEWDIVGVLVVIIGLFFTVGKPIINLNTNITVLNESLRAEKERRAKFEKCSEKEHCDLWEYNDKQDKILEEHTMRLHDLDGK